MVSKHNKSLQKLDLHLTNEATGTLVLKTNLKDFLTFRNSRSTVMLIVYGCILPKKIYRLLLYINLHQRNTNQQQLINNRRDNYVLLMHEYEWGFFQ